MDLVLYHVYDRVVTDTVLSCPICPRDDLFMLDLYR